MTHSSSCGGVLVQKKMACKRLGGSRCSSGKAPTARSVACVGDNVVFVTGEAGVSAMVGGVAVAADDRPDIVSNRAAEATALDSVTVSGVLTEGDDGC